MSTRQESCLTLTELPFQLAKSHGVLTRLSKLQANFKADASSNLRFLEVEEEWVTSKKQAFKVASNLLRLPQKQRKLPKNLLVITW